MIRKRQAAIDDKPLTIVTVQIEVHADLAASSQWCKPQIFAIGFHRFVLKADEKRQASLIGVVISIVDACEPI